MSSSLRFAERWGWCCQVCLGIAGCMGLLAGTSAAYSAMTRQLHEKTAVMMLLLSLLHSACMILCRCRCFTVRRLGLLRDMPISLPCSLELLFCLYKETVCKLVAQQGQRFEAVCFRGRPHLAAIA